MRNSIAEDIINEVFVEVTGYTANCCELITELRTANVVESLDSNTMLLVKAENKASEVK